MTGGTTGVFWREWVSPWLSQPDQGTIEETDCLYAPGEPTAIHPALKYSGNMWHEEEFE